MTTASAFEIAALSGTHVPSAIAFSQRLESDSFPCSLWGQDSESLTEFMNGEIDDFVYYKRLTVLQPEDPLCRDFN